MAQHLEIPQADRLESVLETIAAVHSGHIDDISISHAVYGIDTDRQGRYYRKAAQILGFVTNQHNTSALTQKGHVLMQNPMITNPLFISSVVSLDVFQIVIQYFEIKRRMTRSQLFSYLISLPFIDVSQSTMNRRVSTLISWLKTLGILEENDSELNLSISFTRNLPIVEITSSFTGLFPPHGSLFEYSSPDASLSGVGGVIRMYKNLAKSERANAVHRRLVDLVSQRIIANGGIPYSNSYVDLASRHCGDYIFEMKSTTRTNFKSQIRKGVSQLYEYRYLQRSPQAKLVLVVEEPLDTDNLWMVNYLESDRDIHLIWDGGDELRGTPRTQEALGFLGIIGS